MIKEVTRGTVNSYLETVSEETHIQKEEDKSCPSLPKQSQKHG
jgi:hypothetical protein